jgi:nitrogen-specific signal transduction histidine kinase/ActR/RegA family two-component response regulator
VRDVTHEKSLEKQLLQAQKMEAIGTLAGGIAHDFNNLLTVILGFSELLLIDKQPDDPEHSDLGKIAQSARNGADLVKRLMTFSRQAEMRPRSVDLNYVVRQAEQLLRRTIPRMVDIRLDLAHEPVTIFADPGQMEQMVVNLAVNAKDAMPKGGRLTIKTEAVSLDEEYCKKYADMAPGRCVLLTVSDTGQGMEKEVLERIFEPFFTTKRLGDGTGLGLAMVYGIVKGHGGHISGFTDPGRGTTFKIYLPLWETETETDSSRASELPTLGTETILLVDDEEFIRELGARILTRSGYTVLTARDGREALDIYHKEKDSISLVLLDLIMPRMGGRECLAGLLAIDPEVKVIIASGYSAEGIVKESAEAGTRGFVTKPFDQEKLLGTIRRVLDENRPGTKS